jgi:hypothetical protein
MIGMKKIFGLYKKIEKLYADHPIAATALTSLVGLGLLSVVWENIWNF